MPLDNAAQAIIEGAALNIGASALWDFAKYFGSQLLTHLNAPRIRKRVLQNIHTLAHRLEDSVNTRRQVPA